MGQISSATVWFAPCCNEPAYNNKYVFTFIQILFVDTVTINKKKYVVIEQKAFEQLQEKATVETEPHKKQSLASGKKYAYKLIDTLAKEK